MLSPFLQLLIEKNKDAAFTVVATKLKTLKKTKLKKLCQVIWTKKNIFALFLHEHDINKRKKRKWLDK